MDDVPEDPSLQLQRQITQVSGETNATAIALAMLISSLEDGQRITPAWRRAALTKLATGFADVERSRSGDPVETLTEAATEIAGRIFHDDAPQVSLMAFTPLSRIGCWWRRLR
ncbi:MAG: hypothetical protein ACRYHQ_02760 [Janthinobacterium lividum]